MHDSVPFELVGKTVDVALHDTRVDIMHGGQRIASHPRLRGRKGQYSTDEAHMPPNHRHQGSPWSPERFSSWADRVGPQTGIAVRRMMERHAIVEQSFVACRNVLGLSKTYSPALLEGACARLNATGTVATYAAVKAAMLAVREEGAAPPARLEAADRTEGHGRVRGADAYRRKGGARC